MPCKSAGLSLFPSQQLFTNAVTYAINPTQWSFSTAPVTTQFPPIKEKFISSSKALFRMQAPPTMFWKCSKPPRCSFEHNDECPCLFFFLSLHLQSRGPQQPQQPLRPRPRRPARLFDPVLPADAPAGLPDWTKQLICRPVSFFFPTIFRLPKRRNENLKMIALSAPSPVFFLNQRSSACH